MSTPHPSPMDSRPSDVVRSLRSSALERMYALMQITPRQLLAAIIAGALTLGSAFALAAVSGYLITKAWTMPPVLDLSIAVVAVRALGISRGVFRYLERLLTHEAALSGVSRLRTNLYAGLSSAPDAFVARLRRGELLGRIGDDAEEMAGDVIRGYVPAMVAAVMAVVVIATIAPFSLLAAGFMLVGILIATVIAPLFAFRAALVAERDVLEARARVATLTLEAIENPDVLRVSGRWQGLREEITNAHAAFDAAIDTAASPAAIARTGIHIALIPALLGSIIAAGAVYFTPGVGPIAGFMGSSPGIIGILILVPLSSFEAASVLPMAASQRARSLVAASRLHTVDSGAPPVALTLEPHHRGAIRTVMNEAAREALADIDASPRWRAPSSEQSERDNSTPVPSPAQPQPSNREGTLRVDNLTVGWSPHAPLVHLDTLTIGPGAATLIYGASGRGKSTLAMTLAGLIPPLEGQVYSDGRPLTELSDEQLRARIVYFAEDAHVFSTSVRENIRVVRGDLNDEDITRALEKAGLASWLEALPRGLDTPLGSNAVDVSGGERRRLLLARAIARGAPVTILDEPTEHLDPQLAHRLLDDIVTPGAIFPASSAVVVITHDTRLRDAESSAVQIVNLDTITPEPTRHDRSGRPR